MDPDQRLWKAWKAVALPKHARAEIDEDSITISVIGDLRHAAVGGGLGKALTKHLRGTGYTATQGRYVTAGLKVMKPDLAVAPDDTKAVEHPEGVGLLASGIPLVAEVVWPDCYERRDQEFKPRAYASADIPVYVIIDDYDHGGTVTILSRPDAERRAYAASTRIPYGEEAVIPEGPAKGFVIGPEITGERRG
ncbi:Uma2 family endonuclease [Kitasatospora sp. NPDC057940]|uniref:Uma2 family endonuclease n=1 Tax=Kitasatospora sp. NPDC057940 TaxID=3346285 RepID=UPI0036D84368